MSRSYDNGALMRESAKRDETTIPQNVTIDKKAHWSRQVIIEQHKNDEKRKLMCKIKNQDAKRQRIFGKSASEKMYDITKGDL